MTTPDNPPTALPELVELDPRTLLDNPLNPRTEIGDVSAEADSIREIGLLEPLVVVPVTRDEVAGHMPVVGHRRRAAAIEAGMPTVPCLVRPDYAGREPEQLADMLAENLHRRDLTAVEESAGYAQLAMFDGWTPQRISRRVSRPLDRVKAGLAAAYLPRSLQPAVVDGAVTLEQAAEIEEFTGDVKAHSKLLQVAAAHPAGLHYALSDARHRREVEHKKLAAKTALADAGVRLIGKPKDFPYSVEQRLTDLTDHDDAILTPESHAGCPGHAAFIDGEGDVVYVCRHPKDYDHVTLGSDRHRSQAEIDAAAEQAAAREARKAALAVADDARLSFLTDYLARRGRPPAGTLRAAITVLLAFDTDRGIRDRTARLLNPATTDRDTAPAILTEALTGTADNRLPMLLLAYAAAAGEGNLRNRDARWAFNPAFALHWLDLIASLGYPLSDAETQLRADCEQRIQDQDEED